MNNSSTFGYRFTMGFVHTFIPQHLYSYFTAALAPDHWQELGPRRWVAHFLVSKPIRLVCGQELRRRGPELQCIACFPGNQAQIELV